jgi:hypothetical protein
MLMASPAAALSTPTGLNMAYIHYVKSINQRSEGTWRAPMVAHSADIKLKRVIVGIVNQVHALINHIHHMHLIALFNLRQPA